MNNSHDLLNGVKGIQKNNGILSHSRACKPEHEEDISSMANEASSYI